LVHRATRWLSNQGGGELPADLTAIIAARTEGNPFFIEEVVHSLVETGACGWHPQGEPRDRRLRGASAISVHCLAHQFEARAHDVVRFLGVESLGHAGEAGYVAEEDGDELTALFGRSVAGARRYAR
jgi:hypothetical protein